MKTMLSEGMQGMMNFGAPTHTSCKLQADGMNGV